MTYRWSRLSDRHYPDYDEITVLIQFEVKRVGHNVTKGVYARLQLSDSGNKKRPKDIAAELVRECDKTKSNKLIKRTADIVEPHVAEMAALIENKHYQAAANILLNLLWCEQ